MMRPIPPQAQMGAIPQNGMVFQQPQTRPTIVNPRMAQAQAQPQQGAPGGGNPVVSNFIQQALKAGHHPNDVMEYLNNKFAKK